LIQIKKEGENLKRNNYFKERNLIQIKKEGENLKRNNYILLLLVYVLLLVLLSGCSGNGYIPVPPQGQITPGGMAYTWYDWPQPSGSGFYNFDVLLTIDVDPGVQSAYYWAHQFSFKNGDGGYMGLQTNGHMQGEWVGKMAIFSIWEALEAEPGPGASCESFTGEGKGRSCRIPYEWVEGHTYCLRIWEICCAEQPWEDEWWGAWIIDASTEQETFIGKIKVPGSWQWLDDSSVVWAEYYGQVNGCNSIPYAKVRFEQPIADDSSFMPQKLTPVIGTTCTNAQVTLLENKGVIFETGSSL